VRGTRIARRVALVAMALVTAWSLLAWAQSDHPRNARPARVGSAAAAGETERRERAKETREQADDTGPAPMNWTQFGADTPPFIAMLVNFGILLGGYYLLGKRPIAAALRSRRDGIAKDIDEAQRMKAEAEARAKTYQAKLERVAEEARAARDALLRTGEAERDRIVKDAEAKADRMRRDAEFLVQQELKQIRLDLLRDTVEMAVLAAGELLAQRITQEDQERLAEAYLAELGGGRGTAVAQPADSSGTRGSSP
jgi:F-type H+-transporting ATPase subunit b